MFAEGIMIKGDLHDKRYDCTNIVHNNLFWLFNRTNKNKNV